MRHFLFKIFVALAALFAVSGPLSAEQARENVQPKDIREYTPDNPLVYEDAWDLWPYCFRSDTSEDMGFNVDLIRLIMEKLNIPYVVKLKERSDVLKDMREGKVDLTFGMRAPFHDSYGYYSESVIQLFTHSVVWPKSEKQLIFTEDDIRNHPVMVHDGSYSHYLIEKRGWKNNIISVDDMKDLLLSLAQKGNGHVIWNTASLKWLMRNYHLENLQIAPVAMDDGEYRFISRDSILLKKIDKALNELRIEGAVAPLQNTWFYPNQDAGILSSWIWYIFDAALVALVILALFILLAIYRKNKAIEHGKQHTRRLALIMHTSRLSIWLYDVSTKTFLWIDQNGVPSHRYTWDSFAKRLTPSSYKDIIDAIELLSNQEKEAITVDVDTYSESDPTSGTHTYSIAFTVVRMEDDKPSLIMAVCTDVTEDRQKQREAQERLLRYHSVFNTVMVDMVYYDENGYIANMNERAQQTLKMDLEETIKEGVTLKQVVDIDNFDYDHFDFFAVTRFLNSHGEKAGFNSRKLKESLIYDFQLFPLRNEEGKMLCAFGTGLDITETINAYRRNQKSIADLMQATKEVTDYVKNINYVMGIGGVRLAAYSPDTHLLTIYKGLDIVQQELTQTRCMMFIDESSKRGAMKALNQMDARSNVVIDKEITTTLRIKGSILYLHFSFIPILDDAGGVKSYFGMCRNISEIKMTELLLEKESEKARELENLQNSFLRNMSYEIRTPLNAVVGFAELFELDHSAADEDIFIHEIKKNSAHLLQLINDILFLSRIDAHMIEIKKQPTDFALTFDAHCQVGWENKKREGVRYLTENLYEQLIVEIDDSNIGLVIEQIVSNAVEHTEKGFVRARYDYMGNNLMIMIEDSGCGISEKHLEQIYERFSSGNNGTGLGLPICKALIEQMGGKLDVISKVGEGTSVLISLPCEVIAINRKKDF